ncbi:MAG: Rsd/AlgQ family anti-sigma factor [Acidiferrobacterales bacterium]
MITVKEPSPDQKSAERRNRSLELTQKLITERTEMLVLFCRLAGIESYAPENRPVKQLLEEFCQILVDYISAGHFALYERIVEGNERRRGVAGLAEQLYPGIARTTDAALHFNDIYDRDDHREMLEHLPQELSQLGEQIAVRIELEDQLIAAIAQS